MIKKVSIQPTPALFTKLTKLSDEWTATFKKIALKLARDLNEFERIQGDVPQELAQSIIQGKQDLTAIIYTFDMFTLATLPQSLEPLTHDDVVDLIDMLKTSLESTSYELDEVEA